MPTLTPRERVQTALNHAEPDRVPAALGGGPYGIVDDLYFKLLEVFDLGEPVAPFRAGHNISYLDDRVFDRLGVDTRYVWPGASPNSPSQQTDDPDTFLDSYGQVWKRALPYFYADTGILNTASQTADIDKLVTWPDTTAPRWTAGVAERAAYLRRETDCFVAARMVTSHGIFQTACDLRGTVEFMMDLALNVDFAVHLLDRVTATIAGLMDSYLAACGDNIDLIELPGDDYASNENLLISPGMFRQYIKPRVQQLVDVVRKHNPAIKIMLHSDGMIYPLLQDFIDLGIDVVHPLEPVTALDQAAIKQEFDDRLAFIGGIDISHAMPGTVDEVRAEVQTRIAQLGHGGGYIVAPSNHLQADVPPENVIALFEAVREFGAYPLA
jgi:uroporphyrinogen decarboxylase